MSLVEKNSVKKKNILVFGHVEYKVHSHIIPMEHYSKRSDVHTPSQTKDAAYIPDKSIMNEYNFNLYI